MSAASFTATTMSPRTLRTELGISRERMARLFDVSAKTIERWELRTELPPGLGDRQRLAQLREIVDLGRLVYSREGLRRFLTTPAPDFDDQTPLQLVERGAADRVLAALAQDYEGLGP